MYVYIYTWIFHPGIILDSGLRAWNFEPHIRKLDPDIFGGFVI